MPEEAESELEPIQLDDIVRRVGNEFLEPVFRRIGIALDDGWKSANARNIQPLVDAAQQLDEDDREKLGVALKEIALVGREKKRVATMLSALHEWSVSIPDGFESWTSPKMAAWCFATLTSVQWSQLKRRAEVGSYSPGEWRSYDLQFTEAPEIGRLKACHTALERIMESEISKSEYRGHHCRSECYQVDSDEYVIFKLTDHVSANDVWDEETQDFKPTELSNAFRIVCAFDYENNRLSIHYPESTPTKCAVLSTAFADGIFGASGYTHLQPVIYKIDKLLGKWKLPAATELGVKGAYVVGIEIMLDGNKRRRRAYYEDSLNLADQMKEELGEDTLRSDDTRVIRANIRVNYLNQKGTPAQRTFVMSGSTIGGLKEANPQVRKMFKAYVEKIGLVAGNADSDAH